jgi:HicB-like protein involved in pilus formation
MQTTPYVDALLSDLEAMASLGDPAVADAAQRLSQTLRASANLRLLDLLGEAALEVSGQLPSGHVEVRLAGQEPSLVYVEEEPSEPAPAGAEDGSSARITLRLSETLKVSIEAAATREGVSVNTWIVRALNRTANAPASSTTRRSGRRLTGYAES